MIKFTSNELFGILRKTIRIFLITKEGSHDAYSGNAKHSKVNEFVFATLKIKVVS